MCLIAIATRIHPLYPLIIAANRDEFYKRPTAPLSFWEDHPDILAGRDLQGNGTWLGVTISGRIAAITNFRDPALIDPQAPSRGMLVSNFLAGRQTAQDYLTDINSSGIKYNGFNLVVGDVNQLWCYSNKKQDIVKITPGIHVISNHLMDTPWPKTEKIRNGLLALCEQGFMLEPEDIFRLLHDTRRPADEDLPDTGVGLAWERILSSVFVASEAYGTRSSAVILVDNDNRLTFLERTFDPGKDITTGKYTRTFEIKVPG